MFTFFHMFYLPGGAKKMFKNERFCRFELIRLIFYTKKSFPFLVLKTGRPIYSITFPTNGATFDKTEVPVYHSRVVASRQKVPVYLCRVVASRQKVPVYHSRVVASRHKVPVYLRRVVASRQKVPVYLGRVVASRKKVPLYHSRVVASRQKVPVYNSRVVASRQKVPVYLGRVVASRQKVPVYLSRVVASRQKVPVCLSRVVASEGASLPESCCSLTHQISRRRLPPMWKVAVNRPILNKQSRTADKGWSWRLGVGWELTTGQSII
jgi:hypothetical protein